MATARKALPKSAAGRRRAEGASPATSPTSAEPSRPCFDPYRPELHYMRGPGPAWHAKHRRARSQPSPLRRWPASRRPIVGFRQSSLVSAGPIAARPGFAFFRRAAFAFPPPRPASPPTRIRSRANPQEPPSLRDSSTTTRTSPSRWPTGRASPARSRSPCSTGRSAGIDEIARALQGFDMIVLTRERTAFPTQLIEPCPNVRLIVSTGKRNWMLDVAAAKRARHRGLRHADDRQIRPPASRSA